MNACPWWRCSKCLLWWRQPKWPLSPKMRVQTGRYPDFSMCCYDHVLMTIWFSFNATCSWFGFHQLQDEDVPSYSKVPGSREKRSWAPSVTKVLIWSHACSWSKTFWSHAVSSLRPPLQLQQRLRPRPCSQRSRCEILGFPKLNLAIWQMIQMATVVAVQLLCSSTIAYTILRPVFHKWQVKNHEGRSWQYHPNTSMHAHNTRSHKG